MDAAVHEIARQLAITQENVRTLKSGLNTTNSNVSTLETITTGLTQQVQAIYSRLYSLHYKIQRVNFSSVSDAGTATAGDETTLTDETKEWDENQWAGYGVRITAGTGAGQVREIVSNTSDTLTVDAPWETPPDTDSVYQIYPAVPTSVDLKNGNYIDATQPAPADVEITDSSEIAGAVPAIIQVQTYTGNLVFTNAIFSNGLSLQGLEGKTVFLFGILKGDVFVIFDIKAVS